VNNRAATVTPFSVFFQADKVPGYPQNRAYRQNYCSSKREYGKHKKRKANRNQETTREYRFKKRSLA